MHNNTLIVSDTGPIITFCCIDKIDILKHIFHHVYIPRAVYNELDNKQYPKEVRIIDSCDFITVTDVVNQQEVEHLIKSDLHLHRGESEAIVLAEELSDNNESYLIIDDRSARDCANARGINTIGAIRVISLAIERGLIKTSEIEQIIAVMKGAHRFYSDFLYEELSKSKLNYEKNYNKENRDLDNRLAQKYKKNDISADNPIKTMGGQVVELEYERMIRNSLEKERQGVFLNLMKSCLQKHRNDKENGLDEGIQLCKKILTDWDNDKIQSELTVLQKDLKLDLNIDDFFYNMGIMEKIKNKDFHDAYMLQCESESVTDEKKPLEFMKKVVKALGTDGDILNDALEIVADIEDRGADAEFKSNLMTNVRNSKEYRNALGVQQDKKTKNID